MIRLRDKKKRNFVFVTQRKIYDSDSILSLELKQDIPMMRGFQDIQLSKYSNMLSQLESKKLHTR